jgi:ParB-like chromosome segregation protein Spo0J
MKRNQRKVNELIPYINNSRTHSDAQIGQIAASIREFGWTNPILIDGENGIIAGHGRLKAAMLLGMEEVPVIELSHLSETQKKAYIIADNKLAMNAGWDMELLKLEISELEDKDFNLDLLGFDPSELQLDEPDYSVLDDEDIEKQLDDMAQGVRKAIQIEFEPDHYEEATQLVKYWREQHAYVGYMIMDFLRKEKNKA